MERRWLMSKVRAALRQTENKCATYNEILRSRSFGCAVTRAGARHEALRPSLSCFEAIMTVDYESSLAK